MSSKLKHVVIFEGPDVCGKTTSIENLKAFLKSNKKYEVYTPRFPNYNACRGEEIKKHLSTFVFHDQYEKERPLSILNALDENSINMMINKLDVISGVLIKEIMDRDCDIVLIDRFVMSQFIYDYCWIGMFEAAFKAEDCYKQEYIEKFAERIREFEKEIYDRASIVWNYFVHKIHNSFGDNVKISNIVFQKSDYITDIFKRNVSKDLRKYDAYDKMHLYQNLISEQFEKLSNANNEKVLSLLGKEKDNLHFVNFDTVKEKTLKELSNKIKNVDNLTKYDIQNYVTEEMNYILADIIGEEFACEEPTNENS